jgi:peroxiredoxin
MNRNRIAYLLLFAAVVVALGIVLRGILTPSAATVSTSSRSKSPAVGLQVGNRAPDFSLVTADGKKIHLHDFKGKPVVILFSSTDCISCKTQVSETQQEFASQWAAHKVFALLGIDLADTAADTMRYDSFTRIAIPVLLTQTTNVAELYQITSVPTSVFIARDGLIRAVVPGEMDRATLQRYLGQVSA